jgi:hypothetical protein
MPETFLDPPSGHDHRRASCNELIAQSMEDSPNHQESDDEPLDCQNLLGHQSFVCADNGLDNTDIPNISSRTSTNQHSGLSDAALKHRAFFIRILALLCACFLSVGSH